MNLGKVILHGTVVEIVRDNDYCNDFFVLKVYKIDAKIDGALRSKVLDDPETVKVVATIPQTDISDIYGGDSLSVTLDGNDLIEIVNHTPHYNYQSLVEKYF